MVAVVFSCFTLFIHVGNIHNIWFPLKKKLCKSVYTLLLHSAIHAQVYFADTVWKLYKSEYSTLLGFGHVFFLRGSVKLGDHNTWGTENTIKSTYSFQPMKFAFFFPALYTLISKHVPLRECVWESDLGRKWMLSGWCLVQALWMSCDY